MMRNNNLNRRQFFRISALAGMGLSTLGIKALWAGNQQNQMKLGLVTYQWGKDWDLPTLIKNCETTGLLGVELRTEHAHKVEPALSAAQRKEVKKRFADSKVICVGYGSNQEYHSPDPKKLREQIEGTFELIKLCHDIGATGVKVKPNTFPPEVPREKTIEQIGRSLNEIGKFAANYGQLIRVEEHGPITQEVPNMKAIFEHVDQPNVKMCWNSNPTDLNPPGLEANFESVKKWIGDTVHINKFTTGDYPYQKLFSLLSKMNFKGWILLEESIEVNDKIAALIERKKAFDEMMKKI
jgi:sugar phosphate isomerase/epimerase